MPAQPKLYQCSECGLHHEDETIAKQCQVWCREHKSCNLEITQDSVEAKQRVKNVS